MAPRRGILEVTSANKQVLLAQAPFSEVCGIGYRLTKRLAGLGITSLPQISAVDPGLLLAHFGPYWSKRLMAMAKGEDNSDLVTTDQLPPAKSVSRTYTLYRDTTNPAKIKALLRNLVEEACWKLRQMGLAGRQFGISIRGGRKSQFGHVTTKNCLDDGRQIFEQLHTIYNNWQWLYPVRFMGVWINLLTSKAALTQPLFNQRQDCLWPLVDKINQKYGLYTVFPGTLINQSIVRPEVNGYLGDKHFQLIDKQVSW